MFIGEGAGGGGGGVDQVDSGSFFLTSSERSNGGGGEIQPALHQSLGTAASFAWWCLVKETRPPSESHCISHLREPQPPESSESSAKVSQSKIKNKVFWASVFSFFFLPPKKLTQSLGCCPFNLIRGNREAIVDGGGGSASGTSHTL